MATTLLFIDSKISDYENLMAHFGSDVEVYLLNAEQDGVLQIAEILKNRSYLNSIHIFSHGSSGSLSLGSTVLNNSNLSLYQVLLQQIGSSLSDTGDLLLYGCNIAQGDEGLAFINQLANLTGADVAASEDLTGSSLLGGDWALEVSTGEINSDWHINITAQQYSALLSAAPVATTNPTALAYTENDPATAINAIILSDDDSTYLTAATVSITDGLTAGDSLNFTKRLFGNPRLKLNG